MAEVLLYLVVAVLAFIIGWISSLMKLSSRLREIGILDSVVRELKKADNETSTKKEMPLLLVEEYNGFLFAYDNNTGKFVGQGADQQSLINAINMCSSYVLYSKKHNTGVVVNNGVIESNHNLSQKSS